MSSTMKKVLLFISIIGLSSVAQTRDSGEAFLMLRQAMMDSNKDYNQHKKKANHEEFDRVEKWGRRNSATIVIDGQAATSAELEEFRQPQEAPADREVSSNLEEKNQDL